MEMAVGLAYTCYREFMNLPEGHRIEFADGMQETGRDMWAGLWELFEQMGLTVTTRAGRAEEDRPAKKRRTKGPAGDSQAGQWQQQPRQQQLEPLPVSPRAIE